MLKRLTRTSRVTQINTACNNKWLIEGLSPNKPESTHGQYVVGKVTRQLRIRKIEEEDENCTPNRC
ncbi:hypothetical protein VCR15J2_40291 [Vibrio coralliirubri]|nr:hypothetical protein VCR15J2_40291 [Vibrio coralliirubri]